MLLSNRGKHVNNLDQNHYVKAEWMVTELCNTSFTSPIPLPLHHSAITSLRTRRKNVQTVADNTNHDIHSTIKHCNCCSVRPRAFHQQQEHLESAYLRQGKSSLDPRSEYGLGIRIWTLPEFNGDILVWRYICDRIFMKIWSVLLEMSSELWKDAMSCNVEESFKKFLDPDLEADNYQNLISSSLSTDTSVVNFREEPFSTVFT